MLTVDYITNKVFNSRTYILTPEATDGVWLVDCGDVDVVYERIGEKPIEGVLLTHTHSDHVYGLEALIERFQNVKIFTNAYGVEALKSPKLNISRYHSEYPDIVFDKPENICVVGEGDTIDMFGETVTVYETLGHDPSCLCYRIENRLFTGDAYIPGVKVFTGFPYSNRQQAKESAERILQLSENCLVMPGHTIKAGDKTPYSTSI